MRTILSIDDDAYFRRVVHLWLSRHGFKVLGAQNGAEGLALWETQAPDAIITDFNMPEVDGLGVVERVTHAAEGRVPLIVLTNRSDQDRIRDQLRIDGVYVIAKPFSPSRLLSLLHSILDEPARGEATESPATEKV